MKLIFASSLLLIYITTNLACYNNDILEKVEVPLHYFHDNIGIEYDEYDNIITTTEVPTPRERVKLRTIICSHIISTKSIRYHYAEEDFEQHLKIEHSNLSVINQCAFTNFETITKLFLINLDIKTILPGAFNGLTRLKELHLSDNNLQEISKGVYNSLHRVEILTLNNNKIHFIEDMAFTGTDSLVTLNLQNNKLETFERSLLRTQKHLSDLDLSQNPLTKVSIKNLSSLETLNVSQSLLQEFDDDLSHLTMKSLSIASSQLQKVDFLLFPEVNEIDLSGNKIISLDNCDNLASIQVDLSHNDIKDVNGTFGNVSRFTMSYNQLELLENFLFNASETVISIDFSFNKISTIESYTFLGLRALEQLYLQYNNISKIDTIVFKDLHSLRHLNLSHNNLQELHYGTFDSLLNLQTLDISSNKLNQLHEFTFHFLTNLGYLYFDDNHISSFDAKNLKNHLVSLSVVSLGNNPWKCEDLVNIDQAFKRVHIVIRQGHNYNVENVQGIACQTEREFTDSQSYEKSESVKISQLDNFFNEAFNKSKFVQYFDKDYSQSGFFKYLNTYRFVAGISGNSTDNKMEKLIALRETSDNSEQRILILYGLCQVLIVCTLVCGFFYMSSFFKKLVLNIHLQQIHQTEQL